MAGLEWPIVNMDVFQFDYSTILLLETFYVFVFCSFVQVCTCSRNQQIYYYYFFQWLFFKLLPWSSKCSYSYAMCQIFIITKPVSTLSQYIWYLIDRYIQPCWITVYDKFLIANFITPHHIICCFFLLFVKNNIVFCKI